MMGNLFYIVVFDSILGFYLIFAMYLKNKTEEFIVFFIVNKYHKTNKTNNELIRPRSSL